jgi:hypothetical protein
MEPVKRMSLYSQKESLAFKSSFVIDNLSDLLGKVLTIVDASTSGVQNKAMKDLIREKFNLKQDWFDEVAHTQLSKESYGDFGFPYEGEVVEIK